ncbi:MAG: isopentenyl-diphosphate delta-isomerase, type 1 [Flavipsychrobacter sp.]|jgi:isopentenyl-diphosphate delta-isomerase|nr:isopentenyl-diphosphate delta-isomerase, type 1 [Flavipsychrobacter sp.]
MEYVVLVDEKDNETGVMEKLEAHREGKLHRAVSVFIFNSKNEMLLQQRAAGKYHSGGLWTNACCSHPRQGESVYYAAIRRLYEEMGLKCALVEIFSFVYKAHLDNDLTEHEFDHVFTGVADAIPVPDSTEVAQWKYMSLSQLEADVRDHPEHYTEWFKICLRDRRKELFDKQHS